MSKGIAIGLAASLLASCGEDAAAPSPEQDREMNDAAEMLDQAPSSLSSIDDGALLEGNGDRSSDQELQAPPQ